MGYDAGGKSRIASKTANYCDDVTRPGIHEPVRRLSFVHNVDNHDVNYDCGVNDGGPMQH